MSRGDYERPAWYQIERIYTCTKCGHEQRVSGQFQAQMPCPDCGGFVQSAGESYPASADDWDEVKIGDAWVNKKDIPGY